MVRFDPNREDFAPYGFTCEVWTPHTMPRPDRHEEIEINFLDQGTLTYVIGGERITLQPRTMTLFWATAPHQIVAYSGVTFYYVVTIPFSLFLQWGLPEPLLSQLVMGQVLASDDPDHCESDAMLLDRWTKDLASPNSESYGPVFLELQARLMRMAGAVKRSLPDGSLPDSNGAAAPAPSLAKAEQIACYIARNYTKQLRVEDIASSVGLHPDYASTLFRKSFGITLGAQLARHRVAEVKRRLVTSEEPIIEIAYQAGFDSLSTFNRTFKASTGMTPRTYRKRYRVADEVVAG